MTQLALKQATIEYAEFGPQDSAYPPVVFVHGVLVDGEMWREVADRIARDQHATLPHDTAAED